jgi:hypothetical protein
VTTIYAVALFLLGLAYRATFIADGYSPTDEGWLQSLAGRVVRGEVPYRDFNFTLPPVTLYKEALLMKLFGDAYGILAARWAFAIEASIISVLIFFVMRRFCTERLAFLLVVPTVFFSIILFYYPSYGMDGVFMSVVALVFLLRPRSVSRFQAVAAGAALGFAFLAKPPYLGLLGVVFVVWLLARWKPERGSTLVDLDLGRRWWYCLAGFTVIVGAAAAYFSSVGALQSFLYQSFVLKSQTHQFGLLYLIWEDLPSFLFKPPHVGGVIAAIVIAVLLIGLPGRWRRYEPALIGAILSATLIGAIFRPATWGWLQLILATAYGFLLGMNLVAAVSAVLVRARPQHWLATRLQPIGIPLELPLFAFALEYFQQYGYTGVLYSYEGAFLTLPTALLFVYRLSQLWPLRARPPSSIATLSGVSAVVIAIWLIAGAALVTRDYVYYDAPRPQLTASFITGKLAGVRSRPDNVQHINQILNLVQQRTRLGDPILVLPQFPALYFLTGRTDPTRQEWFSPDELVPSLSQQAIAELQARPPRLVFLERLDDFDLTGSTPVDYLGDPELAPLYAYLMANYNKVAQIGEIDVLAPR